MQLIDKPLQSRISRASKKLGLPEREIVRRAITTYLEPAKGIVLLYRELQAWDALSAETMRKNDF